MSNIPTTVVALQGHPVSPALPTVGQVLQFNGQWTPTTLTAGTGTVTSIATGNGLTGGPITTTGTISLAAPVSIANGGTNATTAPAALSNLGALPLAGGTMTGMLTLFADPVNLSDAATKNYVDSSTSSHGQSGKYRWRTNTTPPPGSGNAAGNNADQTLITILYIDHLTNDNVDATVILGAVKAGDVLYVQDQNNGAVYRSYNVTASGTLTGSYYSYPVTYRAGGSTAIPNNEAIVISTLSDAAANFLPLSGGTMTGALVMNARINSSGAFTIGGDNYPTLGIHEALTVTGSNPGTHGGSWFFNVADTMDVGAGTWWIPFVITHNFDGSTGTGNRQPLYITMQTANGVANQYYVGAEFYSVLTSGSGNVFGSNPYVQIDAAATGANVVAVGEEVDTDVRVNVLAKCGVQVVDISTSTGVGGTGYDCGFLVEREAGAVGYAVGLQFGRYGGGTVVAGSNGVKQTGTILQVVPGTNLAGQPDFAYGIDFRSTTITNSAFASPGFSVSGSGAAIAASLALTSPLTVPNGGTGAATLPNPAGTAGVTRSILQGNGTGAVTTGQWGGWSDNQSLVCYNAVAAGTGGPYLDIARSRGTNAIPTATQSGDVLGSIGFSGYGTAWAQGGSAFLQAQAAENFTATAQGTRFTFWTATPTTLNNVERMRIGQGVMVGTTTDPGANNLSVGGTLTVAGTVGGAGFTTLLAPYAPLASPTFTGTPSLPTGTTGVTQTAGNNTTALATTAFVATSFAPLASPALTGTPTAPTAAATINTTQIATTAYVQSQYPITVAHGGTGLTTGISGGIPYFNATTTMASSAALTASAYVLGGGAGAAPRSSAWLSEVATNTVLFNTNATAPAAIGNGTNLTIYGNDTAAGNVRINMGANSAVASPIINANVWRGTLASRTATQLGDLLLEIGAYGYGNTTGGGTIIDFIASETFTTTACGTQMRFATTTPTTTTLTERLRLAQGVMIGTTTDNGAGTLNVSGSITAGGTINATAQVVTGASGWFQFNDSGGSNWQLYSASNIARIWNSAVTAGDKLQLTAAGDLTTMGNYHYFAGATGTVGSTSTGPLIYADQNQGIVLHLGTGTSAQFVWQNNAGNLLSYMDKFGNITSLGGIVAGSPTGGQKGAGTINATTVYANGTALTSDRRLKRDIKPVPDGCLELVEALVPQTFKHVPASPEAEGDGGPGFWDRTHWGFVAQDIETVMADRDFGGHIIDADGNQSYSPSDMIAVLWKAVQELSQRVISLSVT